MNFYLVDTHTDEMRSILEIDSEQLRYFFIKQIDVPDKTCYSNKCVIEYCRIKCRTESSVLKRESGERPERSGHCKQGAILHISHCIPDFVRRGRRVMICEPGNLLGMREVLPCKALHSAVILQDADDMKSVRVGRCILFCRNVVSGQCIYTKDTSLCEGTERSPQRRDAISHVQMTFRRLNLYNRHSLSLQSAMQQKGCVFLCLFI